MFFIKITLIATFLYILWQDNKDREVYWFLYPIAGFLFFALQYFQNGFEQSLMNSVLNLTFVSILLFCGYCYNLLKLKLNFLQEVLGIGDVLFFIFICFSFSTVSFVVLFVFSLLFSLVLHQIFKTNKEQSVPLAGYMALFFGMVLLLSFFVNVSFLYAL